MSEVVLFGRGRGADVAYRYLTRDSSHEVCGFTVDAEYLDSKTFHGLPVVPFEEVDEHFPPNRYQMLVLLGYQHMNRFRADKYLEAKRRGFSFVSYVNSSIFAIEQPRVGENCFILDNQSINLDVEIGDNVVMWSSNHIGDETIIGDHVWISSNVTVAAKAVIEDYAFVGIGAAIGNRVVVAESSYIGANALITSNTTKGGVYAVDGTKLVADDAGRFMRVMEATGRL